MRRTMSSAVSFSVALMTIPALAQQGAVPEGPGRFYGYGHMWGDGWGWHPGMIFGPLFMLLLLAVVVGVAMRFLCHGRHGFCAYGGRGRWHGAMEILEERFAKGEIDKNEFEEKRKLLGR